MYTFQAVPEEGFKGDIVLDMFNGSGATCVAAAEMKRRFIGIDINVDYCRLTEERIQQIDGFRKPDLIIDRIKMPTKTKKTKKKDQQSLF